MIYVLLINDIVPIIRRRISKPRLLKSLVVASARLPPLIDELFVKTIVSRWVGEYVRITVFETLHDVATSDDLKPVEADE